MEAKANGLAASFGDPIWKTVKTLSEILAGRFTIISHLITELNAYRIERGLDPYCMKNGDLCTMIELPADADENTPNTKRVFL